MVGIRPAKCYRNIERPYTRKSKFKSKSFIKAVPTSKVVRYDMGNVNNPYKYQLDFISRQTIQIRHNSIESSRQVVNKLLEDNLGTDYFFKIKIHPHHVLRENKMITGAGADRLQTGMQLAFGRPVGLAAQVKKGQVMFSVKVNDNGLNFARAALKRANPRLPCRGFIQITKLK